MILWFRRAARKRKTAPSAEFISAGVVCSNNPIFSAQRCGVPGIHDTPYTSYPDEPPPPFSPGLYTDRILEKMQERDGHKQTLQDEENQEETVYESPSESVVEDDPTHPYSFPEYHDGVGEAI